jgi:predicted phosphodiesterase
MQQPEPLTETLQAPTSYQTADAKRLPTTADEAWAEIDQWIGRSYQPVTTPAVSSGHTQRIVVAGDFHAPFHEPALVAQLVSREAGSDVCIINGDIQDFYSISRFTKYERVTIEEELAAVDAILGQLSRAFGRVIIVCGNHDKPRFERQLRSLVSQEMMTIIEFLTGGNLDPVAMLAKRYPNVELAGHQVGRHRIGWFVQLGDLICAHAEKFSKVPGSALRSIEEWFTERTLTLNLEPWRVIIQAHTHQMGLFPFKADQLLIEGGCMCQTHGYQLQPGIMGRPQRRGYVTLSQVDGITDVNTVRLIWWDRQ